MNNIRKKDHDMIAVARHLFMDEYLTSISRPGENIEILDGSCNNLGGKSLCINPFSLYANKGLKL